MRKALHPYEHPVIDMIEDTSPLFDVAVANQKLIDIDPKAISHGPQGDAQKRTTAMQITSDLRLYASGQPREPLDATEKGAIALKHQCGDTKTRIEFTAENANVHLPPLFEFAVPQLTKRTDGTIVADTSDPYEFSVEIAFDKVWFEKTAKTWEVGSMGGQIIHNMPYRLTTLVSETPQFEMKARNAGLTCGTQNIFEPIVVPDLLARV